MWVEPDNGFAEQQPVLGAAKGQDVNTDVGGECLQRKPEMCCSVRQPCSVQVQFHSLRMDVLSNPMDFLRRVAGAEFGGLGDRYDQRLGPMLVPPSPGFGVDQFRAQFAIRCRDREELYSANAFRGAVFIGIDMRCCRADDSAPAREQGLEGKDIGPGSIEDGICRSSCPEVGLDDLLKRRCVDVFAVRGDVSFIGCLNCFNNFGVRPGIVIRGEAPVARVVQAPRQ